MRLTLPQLLVTSLLSVCLLAASLVAQPHPTQPPPADPVVPPVACQGFQPVCSTEKVNRDCFVNLDRKYPITMPTFKLHRGSHITVCVFHPVPFEMLTLDPGPASAYQGSDQASALVTSLVSFGKGGVFGTTNFTTMSAATEADFRANFQFGQRLDALLAETNSGAHAPNPSEITVLEQKIADEVKTLNSILSDAISPVAKYFGDTNSIFARIREVESALPRPVADAKNTELLAQGVPASRANPWSDYRTWKTQMTADLRVQGGDTTTLLDDLPGPCQKSKEPVPPQGPWLPSPRLCDSDTQTNTTSQPSKTPLGIPATYDPLNATLTKDFARLSALLPGCTPDQPHPSEDCQKYLKIKASIADLNGRHDRVAQALSDATDLLPGILTTLTPNMETLFENIRLTSDSTLEAVEVGVIPGPDSIPPSDAGEKKILTVYKALAPTITYTLNEQNEIANSLLSLPAATQKQSIATISALYAAPRFEGSAGAFFSWLPNRTYSNVTNVAVTGGVPAATSIQIEMTKTTPPLIIPFGAANYRISPEFTWLGGRRGAVYLTAGVGLNAYNTQVEYPAGFSFSWRYLMVSPLYHLGHGTHLIDGEMVGQTWCQYGNGATATSTPPLCTGAPPAPATKTYWTGQFAIGISVRVPTTYASTNQ